MTKLHLKQTQQFLNTIAAHDPENDFYFNDAKLEKQAIEKDTVISLRDDFGFIQVTGPDAKTFLQGQLSCDVAALAHKQHTLGCYCNAKGRMLCSFTLFRHHENYYLHLPYDLIDTVLQQLKKYAMFSKVTLEDSSDAWINLTLAGPLAEQLAQQSIADISTEQHDDIVVLQQQHFSYWDIFVSIDLATALWQQWHDQATPIGKQAWHLYELQQQQTHIYAKTQALFTPHSINFQNTGGISFTKGCYVGQEVVARMQYLGKLKQHLCAMIIETTTPLTPGELFYDSGNDNARNIGQLVDIAHQKELQYFALISLKDTALQLAKIYNSEKKALNVKVSDYML